MTDKFNQDGSINENWFAEELTRREKGLKEVDIGQTKEILKVTLDILAEISNESKTVVLISTVNRVDDLLEKHGVVGATVGKLESKYKYRASE